MSRSDSLPRPTALIPALPIGTSAMRTVARRAALTLVRGWRYGHLSIRLPDGNVLEVGDRGSAERAVIEVRDDAVFSRLLTRGELGVGESYVAGDWDSDDLVNTLRLYMRNLTSLETETAFVRLARLPDRLRHKLLRANRKSQSESNIHAHYDLGNSFYELFLDPTMAYSCAFFERDDMTLEQASVAKFDKICREIDLQPGDRLVEIGCGWGGFAMHAAREYGAKVTGITISREQYDLARAKVREAGLDDLVTIEYCDYRDHVGEYDKLVSIEMIEAVGYEFLGTYFQSLSRLLRPGGRACIQAITYPDSRFETYKHSVDWTQTYVFPGSFIPSLGAIAEAIGTAPSLVVDRIDDIGPHYAPTLRAWREAFEDKLDAVRALGMDETFIRTWRMYLSFSEATFAERTLGDAHVSLTRR